jgi:hypothetical protein
MSNSNLYNRGTLLHAALAEGEGIAVARVVIEKAKAGDAVAARFVLGLLCPRPRGRTIALALPADMHAGDVMTAFDTTLAALADGEITPDEALTVTRVLDWRLRALKNYSLASERRKWRRTGPDLPAPSGPFDKRSGGQGEGASPANTLHRDEIPLPPIADAMGSTEQLSKSLSRTARGNEAPAVESSPSHLHSACIQPSPAAGQPIGGPG